MKTALVLVPVTMLVAAVASCDPEVEIAEPQSASGAGSSATAGAGGAGGDGQGGASSSSGALTATAAAAGGGPATSGSTGTGAAGGGGGCPTPSLANCQGHVYDCGNGEDDDGDGRVDAQDPECLGPCDNSETSFGSLIPVNDGPPCIRDCYFDQDSGSGNDECYWNHQCDPLEVPPHYFPSPSEGSACAWDPEANTPGTTASCAELAANQSPECDAYCGPLVPNGCDCFGCCEHPAGSGAFVYLGGTDMDGYPACDGESLDDPLRCHPCTPAPGCLNACDPCEICLFRPELEPGCPAPSCHEGAEPCAGDCKECPEGSYCVTGCCVPTPQ